MSKLQDAPGWSGGASRWLLSGKELQLFEMPPPCAVEFHAGLLFAQGVGSLVSHKREPPPDKPVASEKWLARLL